MNINKILLLIITLLIFNFNAVLSEEKIKLDDEELPAIDPFQGNSSVSSGQNEQASDNSNSGGGLLNGMRLVGTIISFSDHKRNSAFNHLQLQTVKKNEFRGCKTTKTNYNNQINNLTYCIENSFLNFYRYLWNSILSLFHNAEY